MAAPTDGSNVGIAFALVIGASLATGIGASVVFIPNLVKLADHRILASSLGFSAGIMGYVSFVEIFPKSRLSFEQAGFSTNESFNLASICFFCGVMAMIVSTHRLINKRDYDTPHRFFVQFISCSIYWCIRLLFIKTLTSATSKIRTRSMLTLKMSLNSRAIAKNQNQRVLLPIQWIWF